MNNYDIIISDVTGAFHDEMSQGNPQSTAIVVACRMARLNERRVNSDVHPHRLCTSALSHGPIEPVPGSTEDVRPTNVSSKVTLSHGPIERLPRSTDDLRLT